MKFPAIHFYVIYLRVSHQTGRFRGLFDDHQISRM
jgi:hypothetical protein